MDIPEIIVKLADKYGAIVSRDVVNCPRNQGASSGENIYLGEFDSPSIELVAFFHELGHVLSNSRVCKRGRVFTILSGEGLAWELGLGIAFEEGFLWPQNSSEMKYARAQFATYSHDS